MAEARITSKLRIGSLASDKDYRHPVVRGKELATLDVLSGGRLELGVGAGWMGSEYEQAGLPFDPPGTRIDRFEEALRVFKGLFAVEPLAFAGKHYMITGIHGFPRPLQQPHPPILIGAGGRRMLAIAAREADIVGIIPGPLNAGVPVGNNSAAYSAQRLSQKIAWLREAAGERFTQLELSVITSPVFTHNRRQGAEQVAQTRGWSGVSVKEILEMPTIFIGTVEQIAEQMLERREHFRIFFYMTLPRLIGGCPPLGGQLSGT